MATDLKELITVCSQTVRKMREDVRSRFNRVTNDGAGTPLDKAPARIAPSYSLEDRVYNTVRRIVYKQRVRCKLVRIWPSFNKMWLQFKLEPELTISILIGASTLTSYTSSPTIVSKRVMYTHGNDSLMLAVENFLWELEDWTSPFAVIQ